MVASRVGSSGEGGRTAAIEELYEDRQSLAGLNAPQAYLPFLNLSSRYRCLPTEFLTLNFSALNTQAPLMVRTPIQIVGGQGWSLGQTLQLQCPLTRGRVQADLAKANLEEAYLGGANFAWANMVGIFLKGAALAGVDLTGANLRHAHLQGVFLGGEDLEGNYLGGADLDHAKLQGANLREAYFELTQLNQTNFEDAILHRSIFFGVDLAQAQNVDWSQFAPNQGEDTIVLCRVQLPAGVEVDPDRDCEQLHQIFADRYPEVFEEAEIAQGYVQFVYGQIDQQTLIDP
ncbi:MAG: pentapeptide repeat-containing protein [Prochlorothrix sp.]